VIDEETAYQIAYQAMLKASLALMLKASLALMLSHGQRPRVQLGHHIAIIEFAQKHLDAGISAKFDLFDRMRRNVTTPSTTLRLSATWKPKTRLPQSKNICIWSARHPKANSLSSILKCAPQPRQVNSAQPESACKTAFAKNTFTQRCMNE